jgi:DNA mismatch repair ATPase MutL
LKALSAKSPKRSVERFPVFVVALEVPTGWVDVSLEPEKRVVEFTVRPVLSGLF